LVAVIGVAGVMAAKGPVSLVGFGVAGCLSPVFADPVEYGAVHWDV
jgi:hypothetical protein